MRKFWKWINQAEAEERVLELNGTIAEESWFDDDITPRMFKDELYSGSGPITVWINSPGGDCIAASQIYSMLMDYKGEVTVKIDGIAASAASVIAMAGTKVVIAPTALIMIHNPSTTISLGVDDIGNEAAVALVGATLDSNGVLISGGEDISQYVAIGFRAKKSNGKYKYYWLYRVLFGIPATNLATKGDSITFSTPTIEGAIYRRNKPDGKNKHPWKAEVTETQENSETISAWYDSVYEPAY